MKPSKKFIHPGCAPKKNPHKTGLDLCGSNFTNLVTLWRHWSEQRKKPGLTFHYTGCLIGILIMVYYNAPYHWVVCHPLYNLNNQGFFQCSSGFERSDFLLDATLKYKTPGNHHQHPQHAGCSIRYSPKWKGAGIFLVYWHSLNCIHNSHSCKRHESKGTYLRTETMKFSTVATFTKLSISHLKKKWHLKRRDEQNLFKPSQSHWLVVFYPPIWKIWYSQNGFIFPDFLGENSKNMFHCHHLGQVKPGTSTFNWTKDTPQDSC